MSTLIYVALGVLVIGNVLFLLRANRRLRANEDQAIAMYAASLRSLAERTRQLAQNAANHDVETDQERLYWMGQADAFNIMAVGLDELADKAV